MNAKFISIFSGLVIAVSVAYAAGMWTTHKGYLPWQKVSELQTAWRSFRATGLFLPEDTYARRARQATSERHTVNDAARVAPGVLAINRYDPTTRAYTLDLIDETGELLHSRPLDYSRIVEGGNPASFVHIATLLPDGSALVVYDDDTALARIDACGDPIWARTDQIYHHSIERGDEGFWTWQSSKWNGGHDQKMIRFDPETGDILETIDLIDDVVNNSVENELDMIVPEGFKFDRGLLPGQAADIFHPNDVKPLRAEMADAFPQFSAGDLLVSFRNINMLAVIDRQNHDILWAQYGPWQHQHDADFQKDGTITVFSNNVDRFRSSIVQIDPGTGETRDKFHGSGLRFSSYIMGKQQHMENGNWLLSATMQGRVIEVTDDGQIVREYNNVLDEKHNAIVPYAEHLPTGYLAGIPVCTK